MTWREVLKVSPQNNFLPHNYPEFCEKHILSSHPDTVNHISANAAWICFVNRVQRSRALTHIWKPWESSLLHSADGIILLSSVKSKVDLSSTAQRESSLGFPLLLELALKLNYNH